MIRTTYVNGNDLTLQATGCDGCSPSIVQGLFCHESGCPDAWRDRYRDCGECGFRFLPWTRYDAVCVDCQGDR